MALSWDPSLAVGVELIDEQHQELFRRVDVLLGNMRRGQVEGELEKLFAFLDDYVREHFAAEEGLMTRFGYPLEAAHRAQHRDFAEGLAEQRAELEAHGLSAALLEQAAGFLLGWLQSHIATADLELGRFLVTSTPPRGP